MKRFLCILLSVFLLLTGGCAAKTPSDDPAAPTQSAAGGDVAGTPDSDLPSDTNAPASDAPSAGAVDIAGLSADIRVDITPDPDGQYALSSPSTFYGAFTADGMYAPVVAPDGVSQKVFCVDYASRQMRWLCADPDCRHDSESCTAWWPSASVSLFASGENLFAVAYPQQNGREQPQSFYKMNLDGSDRQLLYTLPDGETLRDGIALDAHSLFFPVEGVDGDTGAVYNELRRLDLDTNQTETVGTLNARQWLMDAFEHYLVLTERVQRDDTAVDCFYTVDLLTGEKDLFFATNHSDARDALNTDVFLYGRTAYLLEQQPGEVGDLYAMDVLTGEKKLLTQGLPFTASGDAQITGVFDESLFYRLSPLGENRQEQYHIDGASGQVTPISLYDEDTSLPVAVRGQYGDAFLVECGYEQIGEQLAQGPGAAGHRLPITRMVYAFISREDLLAGNPNYQYIDTALTD